MQQLWQQINIFDCSELTDATILVIISKPDFDLTQDDLDRAKLSLEDGYDIVIFKDEKNLEIGFVVRSSIICNDEDFLSHRNRDKTKQQILKQKAPLEWLSWYKNIPGWFPICIFNADDILRPRLRTAMCSATCSTINYGSRYLELSQ